MDRGVGVQALQGGEEGLAVHVRGQHHVPRLHAHQGTALHGSTLIGQVIVPLSDPQDRQDGNDPLLLQFSHVSRQLLAQRSCHRRALHEFRHFGILLFPLASSS